MIASGGYVVGMGLIGYFGPHTRAQQRLLLQGHSGDVEAVEQIYGRKHTGLSRDYRTMRSDIVIAA